MYSNFVTYKHMGQFMALLFALKMQLGVKILAFTNKHLAPVLLIGDSEVIRPNLKPKYTPAVFLPLPCFPTAMKSL
jgi:hypothetical protein